MAEPEDPDSYTTRGPVCPYCEFEINDPTGRYAEAYNWEMACPKCANVFLVSGEYLIIYRTSRKEDNP